jgi:hypothetical protein
MGIIIANLSIRANLFAYKNQVCLKKSGLAKKSTNFFIEG